MVKLHIKKGNIDQFLYETTLSTSVDDVIEDIVAIYNGRLKIERLCTEIEELAKHGTFLPYEMQGLTEEQINELHLIDEWGQRCIPSGGYVEKKDEIGRRNGKAPNDKMFDVLKKTIDEAKSKISKKLITANVMLTQETVQDAMDILRGAVMIAYPMNLPPFDPIRMEFENREDLSGTQASLEVIEVSEAQLWLAGKELLRGKKLLEVLGRNEKTKAVLKLQKRGEGPPGREPVFTEEQRKEMMMHAFRKQEELKKLRADEDDNYLNSEWADSNKLKRQFQGVKDIVWRPR